MKVDVENYGALVILNVNGAVESAEVQPFIEEMAAKCEAVANIVVNLSHAEISPAAANPLFALRDQQRYLKPRVLLVSPNLELADTSNMTELFSGLEVSEAKQIAKLVLSQATLKKLKAKGVEIEARLRAALGLGEGYSQEDYDAARATARERCQKAKLLAAATSSHAEILRKSYTPVSDDPARDKRLADANAKAYSATRGE